MTTNGGQIVIRLHVPRDRSSKYEFRYLLFKSKQTPTECSAIPFERFVFYEKKSDFISYLVQFSSPGRYRLDVFGCESGQYDSFDLVCSYMIQCTEAGKDVRPLPDCPDIGWGPGSVTEQVIRSTKKTMIPLYYSFYNL